MVEWEIEFARGRRMVNGLQKISSTDQLQSMSGKGNLLQDKDMILVTPKKVMRKNYLGVWEEVRVAQMPILIPIIED